MITPLLADGVMLTSLLVSLTSYVVVSKRERSYINILTPSFIVNIPAYYLLPWFYISVFGTENSLYAYTYVYATLAVENVAFVFIYARPTKRMIRLPFCYSYKNLGLLSFIFIGLAFLSYLPILLQFPEYLLNPRQIYIQTRTGFGLSFFISSTFACLAVILVQFSERSRIIKGVVILLAAGILALHGSKVQVLSLVFLIALFQIYVRKRAFNFLASAFASIALSLLLLLLFAATMALGDSPAEMLETISGYSDYTRNAMMLIDAHFPLQYGRLSLEMQTIARVPRAFWPNKPKNFGAGYLDDEFYPEAMDSDAGPPDFGIGVQYADFGVFAIVYLALFAMLRGWLARVFLLRLNQSRHPADFLVLAFLAGVSLFPVGGAGWLLPEALLAAIFLRFWSCIGADKVYRERIAMRPAVGGLILPSTQSASDL